MADINAAAVEEMGLGSSQPNLLSYFLSLLSSLQPLPPRLLWPSLASCVLFGVVPLPGPLCDHGEWHFCWFHSQHAFCGRPTWPAVIDPQAASPSLLCHPRLPAPSAHPCSSLCLGALSWHG